LFRWPARQKEIHEAKDPAKVKAVEEDVDLVWAVALVEGTMASGHLPVAGGVAFYPFPTERRSVRTWDSV